MITNNGIELVSKYLTGQASSYASHIAIGCGARPLSMGTPLQFYSGTYPTQMATLGTVSGTGPYTATITLQSTGSNLSYIEVGDYITAVAGPGTGSLGAGTVTVTAITGPKTFTISSTSTMTAGTLQYLFAKTDIASKTDLGSKTSLSFETARYPIKTRSYIVDQQNITATSLIIVGPYSINLSGIPSHTFVIGDTIYVNNVDTATGPGTALAPVQVNGLYTVTSTTSSTITANLADPTLLVGTWASSLFNNTMIGYSYNSFLISISGYVRQISLTSETTDFNQYGISELGLYSLGSNQYANSDSRILLKFTSDEAWQYATYNSGTATFTFADITSTSTPVGFLSAGINNTSPFSTDPRYLGEGIFTPGNMAINTSGVWTASSQFAVLYNPGINLSKASTSDELRIAFSIYDNANPTTAIPTDYFITLKFVCNNGVDSATITFSDADANNVPIPANRYVVLSKTLSNLVATTGFDWSTVSSVRLYSSIQTSTTVSTGDFGFIFDGLRYENTTSQNPLYALTAYTIANNADATMIAKQAGVNDLLNFRLDLTAGK